MLTDVDLELAHRLVPRSSLLRMDAIQSVARVLPSNKRILRLYDKASILHARAQCRLLQSVPVARTPCQKFLVTR